MREGIERQVGKERESRERGMRGQEKEKDERERGKGQKLKHKGK